MSKVRAVYKNLGNQLDKQKIKDPKPSKPKKTLNLRPISKQHVDLVEPEHVSLDQKIREFNEQ